MNRYFVSYVYGNMKFGNTTYATKFDTEKMNIEELNEFIKVLNRRLTSEILDVDKDLAAHSVCILNIQKMN